MRISHLIGDRSRDLGPLLRLPCTACDRTQWFHLRHHTASLRLLIFDVYRASAHALHCAKCDYEMSISDEDAGKALTFLPVSKTYADGRMTETEFLSKLGTAGFVFLEEFARANTNWKCDKCGEESPLTFTSCWSCSAARPGVSQDDAETPADPQSPDNSTQNDTGTFGPVKL